MKDDDYASGSSECALTQPVKLLNSLHMKTADFFWVCLLSTITCESFEVSGLFMWSLFIKIDGNKLLKEFIKRLAKKVFYRGRHIGALIERA